MHFSDATGRGGGRIRSISPLDKEMWLQLAADWLSMASIRERFGTDQTKSEDAISVLQYAREIAERGPEKLGRARVSAADCCEYCQVAGIVAQAKLAHAYLT